MKKISISVILLFFLLANLFAQDSTKVIELNEVVISANKTEEQKSDIPQHIEVVKYKQIQFFNLQNTADVLQNLGNLFVQKSQMGGGSPVIRGFEANKILLVIDGIRMNNAIYRGGHLQNAITVDANMIDRLEILHGTGSTIYGSDALGGVISIFTKKPIFESTKINTFARYSSANQEQTFHADLNLGFKKFAFLSGFTISDFGDLRKGNGDFGNCNYFVQRINNKDVLSQNSDPNIQKQSGYKQYDFFQKILFEASKNQNHLLNFQYSTSSNIPRYDRLQTFSVGVPRFSEWYYGAQKRLLASYQFEYKINSKLADLIRITPAFQQIEESRFSRKFQNDWKDQNIEKLNIFSVNADFFKEINRNEIRYGAEFTHNQVDSKGISKNINDSQTKPLVSRYPDGATYSTTGIYASHRWEITDNLIFSDGLRFSYVDLQANFDPQFFKTEQLNVHQKSASLNGNLGLVYLWKGFRLNGSLSTGFRNPNVDDLGRTFENTNSTLIVPNPDLKPEQIFCREIGISKTFANKLQISVQGFYNTLTDAIVIKPTTSNGKDSIIFNGTKNKVFANRNVGRAYVLGFSANISYQIHRFWAFKSNITYTKGRDESNDVPLDHIPPVYGNAFLSFQNDRFAAELYTIYNLWKRKADYSPSGEDNPDKATAEGSPSWQTWNLKSSYLFAKNWRVQAGIENIFDVNYRTFSSGINAAGRNLSLTVRTSF
ncbi:MAG: TonB-dependent receptor [Bacteroidetes bacterium]|nr:MAG: TonB-dependent receptor [Bacteroidota bacterium]